jgi:hypothetical protein
MEMGHRPSMVTDRLRRQGEPRRSCDGVAGFRTAVQHRGPVAEARYCRPSSSDILILIFVDFGRRAPTPARVERGALRIGLRVAQMQRTSGETECMLASASRAGEFRAGL